MRYPRGRAGAATGSGRAAGLRGYLDAGATDVRVSPAAFATDEERLRTWQLVGELALRYLAAGQGLADD